MGRSSGTGSPGFFRCTKCRSTLRRRLNADGSLRGAINRVKLTGRIRQRKTAPGIRNTLVSREYLCLDCDHVGWSSHVDLDTKARRP